MIKEKRYECYAEVEDGELSDYGGIPCLYAKDYGFDSHHPVEVIVRPLVTDEMVEAEVKKVFPEKDVDLVDWSKEPWVNVYTSSVCIQGAAPKERMQAWQDFVARFK